MSRTLGLTATRETMKAIHFRVGKRKIDVLLKRKLPEKLRGPILTFGKLAEDALAHSREQNGEKTTAELRLKFKRIGPDFDGRAASSIPKQDIQTWLLDQTDEQEWTPATRNRYQAAFSLAYSEGIANEKLTFNPASLIKRKPENNERVRFLHNGPDNNEEQRLVAAIAERVPFYLPMFLISVPTGMRRSEQIGLKWNDLDLAKDADGRNILTLLKTKPGKTRRFPVNTVDVDCLKVLRERGSGRGYVFLNTEGNPVKTPRDWFEPCVKLAKLEDYTWHCNRHKFASRLVMEGVDLVSVSKFMGHSTIQMTMRYAHLAPDHQKASVDRIVPADWTGLEAYVKAAMSATSSEQVSTKSATRENEELGRWLRVTVKSLKSIS